MAERIIDLRLGEPVPEGWRVMQLLDTRTETRGVAAGNSSTAVPETIRIHTVLITDAKWIPSDYLGGGWHVGEWTFKASEPTVAHARFST